MIDIQQLVNDKLQQLHDDQVIENAITAGVEKVILKSVEDALTGWEFKRAISEKFTKEVNEAVGQVDFSTYNGFIVSTMAAMYQDAMREDIRDRIEKTLNGVFCCQRKDLKLSEIFEAYRKWVCGDTDESDKYDRQYFHISMENTNYGGLDIKMHPERLENRLYSRDTADIQFRISKSYKKDGTGSIYSLQLDGVFIDKKFKLGHLSDVELMLVQATYNDIPIIIDVEHEDDIDTSYDVDF